MRKFVPPFAALLLVLDGLSFFAAAGDPAKIGEVKGLLPDPETGKGWFECPLPLK
ncbi:MAG: hypothetical protein NTZ84_03635 [Candidatus Nealsonbacteria bacterium]|nr:hypothetical protein [Candidatus Nealsonbacteria bacterium]